MLVALVILLATAAVVSAQGSSIVSSSLTLEETDYWVGTAETGEVVAIGVTFQLEYNYDEGAVARESTEIYAHLYEQPLGFEASLDPIQLEADVDPEGGQVTEELDVALVRDRVEDGNASKIPHAGIVKVVAEAEENGNVESSSAESQQLIPLRNGSAAKADPGDSSVPAATAGSSGAGAAPLAATGLIAALGGAGAGAILGRRFL